MRPRTRRTPFRHSRSGEEGPHRDPNSGIIRKGAGSKSTTFAPSLPFVPRTPFPFARPRQCRIGQCAPRTGGFPGFSAPARFGLLRGTQESEDGEKKPEDGNSNDCGHEAPPPNNPGNPMNERELTPEIRNTYLDLPSTEGRPERLRRVTHQPRDLRGCFLGAFACDERIRPLRSPLQRTAS